MNITIKSIAAVLCIGGLLSGQGHAATPQVGPLDADFAGVDQAAKAYLSARGQAGVSVVVAYGDRIIYAQGYGWADVEKAVPTSPWLEYRLASVSKTFTATAVMRLVEQGLVNLDASAWNYVAAFMGAEPFDARVKQVTVRQLLTHTWGLDRALSQDPNGIWTTDSSGGVITASRDLLRKRLLTMPLDFAPGARYAYDGAGYSWLQLIAETIDGRPLEQQLTQLLGPEPLSTGRVRIGSTVPARTTPAEPIFYDYPGAPLAAPVPGLYPPPAPAQVARPYGAFMLESYGGGGGLMASPLTVARFVQRLRGARQPALLRPETYAQMRTEQVLADGTRYVGLGLIVRPAYTSDHWLSFNGAFPGALTSWLSLPRSPGGPPLTIVALLNGTRGSGGETATEDISTELMTPLLKAVDAIGYVKIPAKPEITGERLIATPSITDSYFSDLLFDWAQRLFTDLFPGNSATLSADGYLYRHYPPTNIYVGTREGKVWLYMPSVDPTAIIQKGTMVDHLPQAIQDTDTPHTTNKARATSP